MNIIIVWEILKRNESEEERIGYAYFNSLEEAITQKDQFPDRHIIEIGTEADLSYTGWF